MAKINKEDIKLKIKLGQCIRVQNVEKLEAKGKDKFLRSAEGNDYVAIQIEDEDGKNERCVLLTHIEHTDMETVTLPDAITGKMVFGRLYCVRIAGEYTYFLKVKHWDGRNRILRVSDTQLSRANIRAIKHPKSLTKKGKLTDLMD